MKRSNGWLWVPSLYLYQGIPYSIVMTTSALFYKQMGVELALFTFWTSLLYLPWSIKPLWSPLVENHGTKRKWVIITQLAVAAAFALLGLSFGLSWFFPISICILALIAFGSASHDIACDGFYMLALPQRQQQFFVGIRTTFYRIAMLAAMGFLPMMVGIVQDRTGMQPIEMIISPSAKHCAVGETLTVISAPHNEGISLSICASANAQLPLTATLDISGSAADDFSLSDNRITLTSAADTARLQVSLSRHAATDATAQLEVHSGNIALGWTIAFALLGGFLVLLALYNHLFLPRPADNTSASESNSWKVFVEVLRSFFSKKGALPAVLFLLLYRLGEAQLSKIATPFLIDDRANGGLAMSMMQYGSAYGTAGMVALTIGGIVGGWLASRFDLRRMIWPMVALMNLPNIVYVVLAATQPAASDWSIYIAIVAEQLGYGFGFTAYMLFLLHYVGDSQYKTAEYALGTTLMALGMMLPGMVSGYVSEALGYQWFFVYVLICCVPGTVLAAFLPLGAEKSHSI